ncbi:GNAT family N-acetyltransferase [Aquibacillus halophilus]|uniref:GNAT family N-acetyltransferase n=1 Tax=Aquibacillus halophilus TaxID=930132 RepID=A0A6A8DJ54_9BACI|nr:GNAT family N-acetyltransferase [Aquibacillus halophilus]MRH43769.1 GNAT family N-acetyltransferase [Aquibacillus halophilus]
MIIALNQKEEYIAKLILEIQLPAYQLEADLINFSGIPALRDTVQTIMDSDETFMGFEKAGELLGVVSYIQHSGYVEICRLIVKPSNFGLGVGQSMVRYVLDSVKPGERVIVSTGTKNYPAKNLYNKLGFKETEEKKVSPGFTITSFKKE